MDISSTFFEYLYCLIDVLLIDKFCSINFKCRKKPFIKGIIFLLTALLIMLISFINSSINYLLSFLVLYLYIDFLYKNNNRKKLILITFIFYTIYGLLTIFFWFLTSTITLTNLKSFLVINSIQRALFIILSRFLIYIGLIIYERKLAKSIDSTLLESYHIIFSFLACLTLLISIYDIIVRKDHTGFFFNIFLLIISVLVMIVCLFKLIISYFHIKIENNEYKHKLYLRQIEQKYYLKSAEYDAEIIQIKHDIKNYFISLEFMLKENRIDEAIKFLNQLANKSSLKKKVFSNNLILNALLNIKILENPDITFDVSIEAKEITITDIDMTILLGNSIDNAIEAVKELEENDREISINIKQEKTLLFINIINKAKNIKLSNNGKLLTKKENKRFHNIGMQNMIQTAKKYNGEVKYDFYDNIFNLKIYLSI